MPIWNNPQLPELAKLKGFDFWKRAGIMFICQLFDNDVLVPFNKLAELEITP